METQPNSLETDFLRVKISIVTVVYNGEKTIRDTIESVLNQDYPSIEFLVIDGGSTDKTREIIASYGEKIDHFVSEPDKGIYDAMNKGIQLAQGEVIGFLNADDLFYSTHVVSLIAREFQDKEIDGVYGDLLYVDSDNPEKVHRNWQAGEYTGTDFLWGWMPPHPSFYLKKKWYIKYGGFRLDMKTAADYELMLRMVHKNKAKLAYIQNYMVRMRVGGASNATLKSRLIANKNDRKAWKVNNLKPYWFTTTLKPFRKILQFFS